VRTEDIRILNFVKFLLVPLVKPSCNIGSVLILRYLSRSAGIHVSSWSFLPNEQNRLTQVDYYQQAYLTFKSVIAPSEKLCCYQI
jgi:hypothetical protein